MAADPEAAVEDVAQKLFACKDPGKRNRVPRHDRKASLGAICRRCERVDCRHLEGQLDPSDACKVDGEAQQVGSLRQRGEAPGEGERKVVLVGRCDLFWQVEHCVLEGEEDARVHLEREMQVERTAATLLRMQIDLPGLAQGVGLNEVPFVVDVESVVYGMVLQIGYIPRHIYDCHSTSSLIGW